METALTLGALAMTSGRAHLVTPALLAGWVSMAIVTPAMLAGWATIVTPAIQNCAQMDTVSRACMETALAVVMDLVYDLRILTS
jgi:hypothetical protein